MSQINQCPDINQNVLLNCLKPMVSGANDRLILIPFTAWQALQVSKSISNPLLITGIAGIPSPPPGYVYEGKNSSVEPSMELVKRRYNESYNHTVDFKVFTNNADVKDQIQRLVKKKVVAIVQNNWLGNEGESAFEVYGADVGLELAEATREVSDPETGGAYNLVLQNSEFAEPSTLPHSIFDTDYPTTLALVNSLLAA
jgi:hypothetical protein